MGGADRGLGCLTKPQISPRHQWPVAMVPTMGRCLTAQGTPLPTGVGEKSLTNWGAPPRLRHPPNSPQAGGGRPQHRPQEPRARQPRPRVHAPGAGVREGGRLRPCPGGVAPATTPTPQSRCHGVCIHTCKHRMPAARLGTLWFDHPTPSRLNFHSFNFIWNGSVNRSFQHRTSDESSLPSPSLTGGHQLKVVGPCDPLQYPPPPGILPAGVRTCRLVR